MKKADSRGMTLVEVVIAMAIFAIILVFALPVFQTFIALNQASETRLSAQELGNNQMESILAFAKGKSKEALGNELKNTLSDDQRILFVDGFSDPTVQGTLNTYTRQSGSHTITVVIDMDITNSIVKISVVDNDSSQTYETLGYVEFS